MELRTIEIKKFQHPILTHYEISFNGKVYIDKTVEGVLSKVIQENQYVFGIEIKKSF